MGFSLRSVFSAVASFVSKYEAIIQLFSRIDITKLNDDDRVAIGLLAAEFRQAGAAFVAVADALDSAKADGVSPEEYAEIAKAIYKAGDELADIPVAAKSLL